MPTLNTHTYGYRRGRRIANRNSANDAERPGGKPKVNGQAKPRTGGRRDESRPGKLRG